MYGNYSILDPQSRLICRASLKRINWYLKRNLAKQINETTIQLLFQPKGTGCLNNPYALADKENICVVCGTMSNLTKHHIVPRYYRRHLHQYKERRSYDVVLLCKNCHFNYEEFSNILREKLHRDYATLKNLQYPEIIVTESKINIAISAARVLKIKNTLLPEDRIKHLQLKLKEFLQENESIAQAIERLATLKYQARPKPFDYGQAIVAELVTETEILQFVQMWRQHFIETMQPQFMPQYWTVQADLNGISQTRRD